MLLYSTLFEPRGLHFVPAARVLHGARYLIPGVLVKYCQNNAKPLHQSRLRGIWLCQYTRSWLIVILGNLYRAPRYALLSNSGSFGHLLLIQPGCTRKPNFVKPVSGPLEMHVDKTVGKQTPSFFVGALISEGRHISRPSRLRV